MIFKRVISFILILAMTLTFGITAAAEGVLEITYLNADNSAIHIEFSGGVKVANLASCLTLTSDGNNVSYTIKETVGGTVGNAVYANDASAADNAAVYDEGTTYTIIPDNGINMGSPYVITIAAGLTSEDASLTLASEIKKVVKVREIFTEDFSKEYILPVQGMALIYNAQNSTFSLVDEHIELTANSSYWGTFTVHPYVPADNFMGNSQTLKMRDYVDAYKFGNGADSEVTVSAKIKFAAGANAEFELVSSWQTATPHSFDYLYCPQYTSLRINNASKTATITSRYGVTNEETNPNLGTHSKEQVSYTKTFADESNNIPTTGYAEIKISELGGKVKAFIDNKNILNLKNATGEANGLFGIRHAYVDCYVDDICITKMEEVEVKPLEYKGIETSPDGIVAEFSGKLDTDVLRGAITFTENGETLSTFELTDLSGGGRYRYLIKPVGGIILDVPYTLSVAAGLEAMDGLSTPLENEVFESFTVTLPEITLSYFDADASAINIEMSEKVDFAGLLNAITLKREGVTEEFDLYDASVVPTSVDGGLQTVTYQIVPKNGMKTDITYSLEIKKGIMSADGESAVMKKDIVKNFKVEKIMYDSFSYNGNDNLNTVWYYQPSHVQSVENGVYKYQVKDGYQGYALIHPYGSGYVGDTQYDGRAFSKTFMQTQKNYTVQADIKIGDASKPSSAGVLALHKGIPENDSSEYNSFDYRIRYAAVHEIANQNGGIRSKIRTWSRPYVDDVWDPSHSSSNPVEPDVVRNNGYIEAATQPLSVSEFKTVRLSVRDGYFKGYLDFQNTSSYYDELLENASGGIGLMFASGCNGQTYYIDNMYITRMTPVLPVTSSIPSGATEVAIKPEVVISTGEALDKTTVNTSTVKVKTDSGYISASDYLVSYSDDGNITVSFKKNLESKSLYYIVLDGIVIEGDEKASTFETISFTTKSLDFEVDSFKVTNSLGGEGFAPGEVTISAKVKNNYVDAPQSFVMSLCIYNEKNQLIGIKAQKYTVEKGGEASNTLTVNLGDGSYRAKCFVWSDFTLMTESLEEKIIE